jgi:hypothetical protein
VNAPPQEDTAVKAVVNGLKAGLGKAGSLTAAGLTEAVDAPMRALTRRAAENAVAAPRPVADENTLARLLAERPSAPAIGNAAAAALAAKVVQRFGKLKFFARRTPMWVVAAVGPALYGSVTRGSDEIALLASHLVHRTRAAGMEPDPERVRRAAVQLATGVPVDTGADARHGPLVLSWVTRALKASLPFGAGVATHQPASLAAAAAAIPPAVVARAHEVD